MQHSNNFSFKLITGLLLSLCFSISSFAEDTANPVTENQTSTKNITVIISTSKGDITAELYPDKAPITVANFVEYANAGFYEGTIFHRVIKRFMIQGGGMTQDLTEKATRDVIQNESKNGLHNDRWTLAMARTDDPHSAGSQFYINTKNNGSLDPQGGKLGYTVFGKVIDGKYVVQAIEKTATHRVNAFDDVPIEPITITAVTVK
jgi:cyclophilin family peptidyl-prolyl cis-trans isomerase